MLHHYPKMPGLQIYPWRLRPTRSGGTDCGIKCWSDLMYRQSWCVSLGVSLKAQFLAKLKLDFVISLVCLNTQRLLGISVVHIYVPYNSFLLILSDFSCAHQESWWIFWLLQGIGTQADSQYCQWHCIPESHWEHQVQGMLTVLQQKFINPHSINPHMFNLVIISDYYLASWKVW